MADTITHINFGFGEQASADRPSFGPVVPIAGSLASLLQF